MGLVRVLKNKAYSKRYQTKFARRRKGKTDYFARKRLVFQDKNKYDSKKYRLVVRRTNRKIICSVNFYTLTGDKTVASADSSELAHHGLTAGLTNYSAAYATGLLCSRRLLKKQKMDDMYEGNKKVDGSLYDVNNDIKDRRPFKCYLDVGLTRTTTGNRVFGALKGACDGGLHIPHNEKRFPGFRVEKAEIVTNKRGKVEQKEKDKITFDAKVHKEHIFGAHVEKYYNTCKAGPVDKFKLQFGEWTDALKTANVKSFEDLYKKVHASIRKNPDRVKKARQHKPIRKIVQPAPTLIQQNYKGKKWLRQKKIGLEARRLRVTKKLHSLMA